MRVGKGCRINAVILGYGCFVLITLVLYENLSCCIRNKTGRKLNAYRGFTADFQLLRVANLYSVNCLRLVTLQNDFTAVLYVSRSCYRAVHRLNINRDGLLLTACIYAGDCHIHVGLDNDIRIFSRCRSIACYRIQLVYNCFVSLYRVVVRRNCRRSSNAVALNLGGRESVLSILKQFLIGSIICRNIRCVNGRFAGCYLCLGFALLANRPSVFVGAVARHAGLAGYAVSGRVNGKVTAGNINLRNFQIRRERRCKQSLNIGNIKITVFNIQNGLIFLLLFSSIRFIVPLIYHFTGNLSSGININSRTVSVTTTRPERYIQTNLSGICQNAGVTKHVQRTVVNLICNLCIRIFSCVNCEIFKSYIAISMNRHFHIRIVHCLERTIFENCLTTFQNAQALCFSSRRTNRRLTNRIGMTTKINDIIHTLIRIATNCLALRILQNSNRSGFRICACISRQCCIRVSQRLIISIANLSYRIGFTQLLNSAVLILNVTLCNICRNIRGERTASHGNLSLS